MRSMIRCATVACCALASTVAMAQDHSSPQAVNKMCPVGHEAIDGKTFVEYKGHAVGFCCPGCDDKFLAWDEARRDAFVEAAMTQPAGAEPEAAAEPKPWSGPYTLDTCPVSGEKLGSMGDPVVRQYEGREVRLCCDGCIKKFEADQKGYWQKIDEQIVRDQLRYYPAETCVVSGEPLVEDGEDIAQNVVYGNRLVRLCCKMCARKFRAEPAKFIEMLDRAAIEAQRDSYPLETCAVRGGKLGSMGDPVEMVVAGRLIRLCCAGCKPKVQADPAKYIAVVDRAWQAVGRFMPPKADAHTDPESNGG